MMYLFHISVIFTFVRENLNLFSACTLTYARIIKIVR